MADFRVGQRVRILGNVRSKRTPAKHDQEGTILAVNVKPPSRSSFGPGDTIAAPWYEVEIDGHPWGDGRGWKVCEVWLRPLTDPKADEFIERIKKLAREPRAAPVAEPLTVGGSAP